MSLKTRKICKSWVFRNLYFGFIWLRQETTEKLISSLFWDSAPLPWVFVVPHPVTGRNISD